MSRPLKIAPTTPISVKEMSDAEMDYSAHQILVEFASANSGAGTVTVNNTDGGTSIGTFIDTHRDAVDTHPVGTTVTSYTYTFRQNLTDEDETGMVRPVEFSDGGIREQNNTELNSHIIARALSRLIDSGLGSYKLQPSAPTSGGTWESIATITNLYDGSNSSNTTKLWRRTAQTAPTTVRPLHVRSDGHLEEMSDDEIQSMSPRFRNRIIDTGVGQYRVQNAAPTTGTWVRVGSAFTDTRQTVGDVSYSGSYTGSYSGTYTGYYAGTEYAGSYAGTSYSGAYAGGYIRYYSGRNYGTYTGYYTGYYAAYYTGYYAASYAGDYTGSYSGTYTGNYTGRTVLATTENVSTMSLWIRTA